MEVFCECKSFQQVQDRQILRKRRKRDGRNEQLFYILKPHNGAAVREAASSYSKLWWRLRESHVVASGDSFPGLVFLTRSAEWKSGHIRARPFYSVDFERMVNLARLQRSGKFGFEPLLTCPQVPCSNHVQRADKSGGDPGHRECGYISLGNTDNLYLVSQKPYADLSKIFSWNP